MSRPRFPGRLAGACLALGVCAVAVHAQAPPSALEAAERSVVRVISISLDQNGQVSDVEEGSGFFVAPGEVITNHHVVAGAAGAATVRVFVIPERDTGQRRQETVGATTWPEADLALLAVPGLAAPALTIATAVPGKDSTVHALGYPGVTDTMRKLPLDEILTPAEPYVTPGAVALTSRTAPGGGRFETIFHTAPINPGNSGGPLIDACGRVIGVNAWVGQGSLADNGAVDTYQGQFAAVGSSVLATFLAREGVAAAIDRGPCRPPIDAAVETRLAAAEAAIALEIRQRTAGEARVATALARDRTVIIAVVVMVALAAIGVTLLALWRRKGASGAPAAGVPGPIVGAMVASAVVISAGVVLLFAGRGTRPPSGVPPRAAAAPAPPTRFEVTCRGAATTGFTIEPAAACVNGRTPYEKTAGGFSRVMTNDAAASVSTLAIAADLTRLERADYPLSPGAYRSLRGALGGTSSPRCGDPDAQARLAAMRAASAPYLRGAAARRAVWRCAAVPWR